MPVEPRIVVGVLLFAVIGASMILIDKLDPYYKTNNVVEAEIINRTYAASKQGSSLLVTVKTNEGRTYSVSQYRKSHKRVGDKVKLRVYQRKITKLVKYKPEWF